MRPWADVASVLHPSDNVAVAKCAIPAGTGLQFDGREVSTPTLIPPGHKLALQTLQAGDPVIKYGQFIGQASQSIRPGDHVHAHNLVAGIPPAQHPQPATGPSPGDKPHREGSTFEGYLRPSGSVGTRNYLAVISSVNCSASVSRYVAEAFKGPEFHRCFPNVDGVLALTHKGGCAMDPGEPQAVLQRTLAGMARHPNIGGYVLIGLGCEVNQIASLVANHRLQGSMDSPALPPMLNIQQVGGVRRTVEAGIRAVRDLLPKVDAIRRSTQPASRLVLALNCGGSDGLSGCTANPALGVASDRLVAEGGTSVLAETPEIYGAEHLLAHRATSDAVREKLLAKVRWWEDHVRLHGTTIDNNPSFGNRQGGLTTIFEKSLGAVAKAGQAPLSAVYDYAEPISSTGLCFMDTPGYDPVSMTGLSAGGCTVAVFTTGRGSVYGCKPTPCIKLATNTPMFRHLEEDMDLNAGGIADGTETLQSVGDRIFETILAVASGRKTRSEASGLGDEEFAPWMLGPTL